MTGTRQFALAITNFRSEGPFANCCQKLSFIS